MRSHRGRAQRRVGRARPRRAAAVAAPAIDVGAHRFGQRQIDVALAPSCDDALAGRGRTAALLDRHRAGEEGREPLAAHGAGRRAPWPRARRRQPRGRRRRTARPRAPRCRRPPAPRPVPPTMMARSEPVARRRQTRSGKPARTQRRRPLRIRVAAPDGAASELPARALDGAHRARVESEGAACVGGEAAPRGVLEELEPDEQIGRRGGPIASRRAAERAACEHTSRSPARAARARAASPSAATLGLEPASGRDAATRGGPACGGRRR